MVTDTSMIYTCDIDEKDEAKSNAKRIAHIQDKVFKKHKCYSSPFGNKWMIVMGDLIKEIAKQKIQPTKEVISVAPSFSIELTAFIVQAALDEPPPRPA